LIYFLSRDIIILAYSVNVKYGGNEMPIVTIIGSGMMGSALAFPARENGNTVRLVGTPLDREIINACKETGKHPKLPLPFPAGVEYYQIEEVEKAIDGADMIIGGVSSFGVEWFGEKILPLIPDSVPLITVTKGLMDQEDGSLITYPDYWQSVLDKLGKKVSLNAIGGPCTSYELVAHDQTEVAFCGKNLETLKFLKSVMATDYYHISLSTDVTGIESAVALKNGYALGIALTIGVNQKNFGLDSELHFNSQAAVFGQATKEMYKLLCYQGAGTLNNLAVGAGDLYVTVYGGRTRLVGILLGRGMNIDEAKAELNGVTLESLVVAVRVARAVRVAAKNGVLDLADFPLLMHVDEIITEKKAVNIPWETFTFEK
jgi:glycerol-3-phosphate dehydrogenase (NAD(P)+)